MRKRKRVIQNLGDEENLYRLQQQFKHTDSIKIIPNQVERYEELMRLQAESIERAKRNEEEIRQLQREADSLKFQK